ncbi:MAG TPA: amidohydrolase family protein [Ohtaekwangia sp.]|nr:amidohydrolase family protein [Ohtaekwangia sp.]
MTRVLAIFFAAFFSTALAQEHTGNLLVKNGTVLTVTKGTLESTDVLVRGGRIVALGKNISAPAGYNVIDATGLYVMPGIIDAHSHLGISDINEYTAAITPEVSVGDVINPLDIAIYRALAGGVTISHAMHGSGNAIGGQCVVIKHRYGEVDPTALKMQGVPRTIKFALGENPTTHGRRDGQQPQSRMGVEFVIREAFAEARQYQQKWDAYNAQQKQKGFRGTAPGFDPRLQILADVLRGDIIVHCHSYRADEILMLINVFRDFGIKKLVFQHVNEGFKVAPELAAFGAMASVFSDWWAYKLEVYYSTAYNAAILTRNGVLTSINSDSGEQIRHLYHQASKTRKYGNLSDEEALALITVNPAKQLGIDHRVGSIEIGKEADLAIFKGHPLSVYAIPVMTVVEGIIRFDRKNDADDMRLYVDTEQALDLPVIRRQAFEEDNCMQGTTDFYELFK